MGASGTPLGLPDAAFGAPSTVQDAYDSCVEKSSAIDAMVDAVAQAARRMDDANWQRFQEAILLNVHQEDMAVHSNLFAQTEPSWRPLLQRPKKRRQSCAARQSLPFSFQANGHIILMSYTNMRIFVT